MDQIIALALGVVASTLQGGKLKTTKPIFTMRIAEPRGCFMKNIDVCYTLLADSN